MHAERLRAALDVLDRRTLGASVIMRREVSRDPRETTRQLRRRNALGGHDLKRRGTCAGRTLSRVARRPTGAARTGLERRMRTDVEERHRHARDELYDEPHDGGRDRRNRSRVRRHEHPWDAQNDVVGVPRIKLANG